MIGRRSFLAGILGAAAAPAIVKAESLMRVVVPKREMLIVGSLGGIERFRIHADGSHSFATLTSEMLRRAERSLLLERFSESRPMPAPSGNTIRFRKYGGTILHASPLHEVISNRKTA